VGKWKGSVEDGVEWLRNWKCVVIHPDCEQQFMNDGVASSYGMITEAKNYSFKTDRLTGDVLPDIVDAFNHGWDSIRYGFESLITKQTSILDVL
jgi:phage terminase large subunit